MDKEYYKYWQQNKDKADRQREKEELLNDIKIYIDNRFQELELKLACGQWVNYGDIPAQIEKHLKNECKRL